MSEDMDKRVEQFIQVRDTLARLEAEHEKKIAPLLEVKELLSGMMQDFLDANKLDNCKTAHGTFHRTTRYTASLADPDAFMNFVIANKLFDLLDRRANATKVRDYVQKTNQQPPGCNLNAVQTIGVRRRPGSGGAPETELPPQ